MGNSQCDGLWIDRGGKKCVGFRLKSNPSSPTQTPTLPRPPKPTFSMTAPRGGSGYFNYDPHDTEYGPYGGWGGVRGNPEQKRYQELSGTLKRSLINKCDWNVNQSPIDLCGDKINEECGEFHQVRMICNLS